MKVVDTVAFIHRQLENAPEQPRKPTAVDLLGWWTEDNIYICAHCAGRIMSRGGYLPEGTNPVWTGEGETGTCCGCGGAEAAKASQ